MPVAFVTAASLVNELMEVRDEKRLLRLQRQLAKVSLLIIPLGTLLRNALPGSG
jgi:DNA replication protein DnaC